ncbi:15119_t:CDS:2, partial [Rhizophagus irregularis]
MMLQEFLKDYKDSPIAHAIVAGAIAFIIAFTLDMFFSSLVPLIKDYLRRAKPVPTPEKISPTKVPYYKRSSRKVAYDNGNRGKSFSFMIPFNENKNDQDRQNNLNELEQNRKLIYQESWVLKLECLQCYERFERFERWKKKLANNHSVKAEKDERNEKKIK